MTNETKGHHKPALTSPLILRSAKRVTKERRRDPAARTDAALASAPDQRLYCGETLF